MTRRPATLLGDLRERADGGFDGWCWAPDRPQERLVVDLLVNDTPAVSMVAAVFRRDLLALGCGDGRHGFSLRLPPDRVPAGEECMISARERRSGQVFGRVLRAGPGLAPPGTARVQDAAAAVQALWQDLAALRAAPAAGMRAAFGRLAGELAATERAAAPLRTIANPALTLVLPARGAAAAHRAALAAALAEVAAEVLPADPAATPQAALAAAASRGGCVVLLDPASAPSAAALLALARAVAAAPEAVLVAEAVADAAAALVPPPAGASLRLPAPLGVLIGGPGALWRQLGAGAAGGGDTRLACADLALRARLLGRPWCVVTEPAAPLAAPAGPPPSPLAVARLHHRWGFGA